MNKGFDTEKRILLAITLSMGFLFGYPYIVKWINPPKAAPQEAKKPEGAPSQPEAPAQAAKAELPKAAPVQRKEELSTVETPLWKAVFTNKGGGVKSWELKKYTAKNAPDSPVVNLGQTIALKGSLDTRVMPEAGTYEDVVFDAASRETVLQEADAKEIVFTGTAVKGIRVEKRYRFTGNGYIMDAEVRLVNGGRETVSLKAQTALSGPAAVKDMTGYHSGPVIYDKENVIRHKEKEADKTGEAGPRWIGMEDKYFLAALMPSAQMRKAQAGWKTEAGATGSAASLDVPVANLAPGTQVSFSYGVFMGPKEYDMLLAQKDSLEESIEFGLFSFLAKPSLVVLNFFKRYLANYGVAIVVFTVILKIVFYPLTKKSLDSMRGMKDIQPQLAAIKEKYKDNKERLNKEMMELYKRYKINPLGGCLPMVLQIPVFIALYEVLYVAIDLRHAPLGLWIRDLSDKDPYYITPIIMGATMFLQQKMTPTTADPMQAKIMLFMPVIFTYMFLSFPSGLVLYWLVNNLLSIGQQYWIQRTPAAAKA
ncbi:MAG: membrane protein insertase YidC [Deltaproteobacteria bacterium]|nr:membrane protein insertase YidC [Deltaproteobacteria bacterium]